MPGIPSPGVNVLIAGAGGFIGSHLARRLLDEGHAVHGADIKVLGNWHQMHVDYAHVEKADLREPDECRRIVEAAEPDEVYMLAADMGGIGFIESHKVACMLSVLISTNMVRAVAERAPASRYFYSSSACVYPDYLQTATLNLGLSEDEVYPAAPEDGYGWEKLFGERMCRHYAEEFGLATRVARYHNIYGPHGDWHGGREKAPAAICRKVAECVVEGYPTIDIWGDGEQTRSFTFIDDCLEGTVRLTRSDVAEPLNVGSSEMVTINELVSMVEKIAGVNLRRTYSPNKPKGVRGRNSDNTLIEQSLGWSPSISLADGLEQTYRWIFDEVKNGSDRTRACDLRPAGDRG